MNIINFPDRPEPDLKDEHLSNEEILDLLHIYRRDQVEEYALEVFQDYFAADVVRNFLHFGTSASVMTVLEQCRDFLVNSYYIADLWAIEGGDILEDLHRMDFE